MAPLPTVLIPGLYATARMYLAQLPALWRSGPVLVADHTRDDDLDAIAERIVANAPPRFALAGLSMGGALALAVLRQAPERVERLALLNATAQPDTEEAKAIRRAAIERLRAGDCDALADASFPLLVHPAHVEDEGLRAVQREMLRATGAEAAIRQLNAYMNRPDARPGLGAIAVPTLVVVGDADRLTPPDRAAELADGIAGARLVTIPECGHISTLEQPDAVTRTLVAWKDAA
jgi:pimeloyl-ACP methyl ester carboxylesterase